MATPALLLHSDPDELLPWLEEACPGASFGVASTPDEVEPALKAHRPEVVFSIKHSGFPGPAHRPALVFPSVRWFQIGGSGREHLGAWDPAEVTVTDCAGVLAPPLAERALAGLLALSTGVVGFLRDQRDHAWRPRRFQPLEGQTLLVVGVGHTGGELAWRARALGMRVLGVRASGAPHEHVDEMGGPDALARWLPEADVVSLHVRLDDSTRHLLDDAAFARMKPGALLLNSARGAVIDTAALLRALDGSLGGAWLDVFEEEPLPAGHALWDHEKVVITPHCADQAEDFPRRFARRFAENWRRRQAGETLLGVVPRP